MGFLAKPLSSISVQCPHCGRPVYMRRVPLTKEEAELPMYQCSCGWNSIAEGARQKAAGLDV
jgi:predicted RNA-binding Zn-ribbon protein involved in translation (DUF1610 family)